MLVTLSLNRYDKTAMVTALPTSIADKCIPFDLLSLAPFVSTEVLNINAVN